MIRYLKKHVVKHILYFVSLIDTPICLPKTKSENVHLNLKPRSFFVVYTFKMSNISLIEIKYGKKSIQIE